MAEIDSRKASLIAEIEVSRFEMRRAVRQCEANLNPVAVLRRSVVNHSGAWLSSAALLGLALSQIVRLGLRRPSSDVSGKIQGSGETIMGGGGTGRRRSTSGWGLSLWGFAYDLFKPLLMDWATARIAILAQGKSFNGAPHTGNGVIHAATRKADQVH